MKRVCVKNDRTCQKQGGKEVRDGFDGVGAQGDCEGRNDREKEQR